MAQAEHTVDHVLFIVDAEHRFGYDQHRAVCTCGYATYWLTDLNALIEAWASHRIQTEHDWFRDLAMTVENALDGRT